MAPRRGSDHHWSGARLPNTTGPIPGVADDIADPAEGETVPRCLSCGLPDRPDNRLLNGTWTFASFQCRVRLCERCVRRVAPWDPRIGDPLQAA